MENRLKREDLRIGSRVTYDQLRDILDLYIILEDTDGYIPNLSGTIAYVTKEKDDKSDEILFGGNHNKCRCIFNSSLDLDEDVSYDE